MTDLATEEIEVDDDGDVVDELAIQLAVEGDTSVGLTRHEMNEAWRRLEDDGDLDVDGIASTLGVTSRTIHRWRLLGAVNRGRAGQRKGAPRKAATVTPLTDTPQPGYAEVVTLLMQAQGSTSKRAQKLAGRITSDLDELRELMEGEAERREAAAEVERLERQLREAKARLKGKAPKESTTAAKPEVDTKAVRRWAVSQGIPVPDRGSIKAEVVEQYRRANGV